MQNEKCKVEKGNNGRMEEWKNGRMEEWRRMVTG